MCKHFIFSYIIYLITAHNLTAFLLHNFFEFLNEITHYILWNSTQAFKNNK